MCGDYGGMGTCYRYCCFSVALLLFSCSGEVETPATSDESVEEVVHLSTTPRKPELDLSLLPEKSQPFAHLFKDMENPSRSMAQMWVESRGDSTARSPFGGVGLMQFTLPTVETAQRSYCAHLGEGDPEDPYWSVPCYEAMMTYMDIEPFDNYCDNKKVDECRYNGGWWCVWELRAAPIMTFESAESICGKVRLPNGRMRSDRACKENYLYDDHISKFQPLFMSMGGETCD